MHLFVPKDSSTVKTLYVNEDTMKLSKIANNRYKFEIDGVTIEGNFDFISNIMLEYGIEEEETVAALKDIVAKQHDVAFFGLAKTFLYTKKDQNEKYLALELKAVAAVRAELELLTKEYGANSPQAKSAFDRLINLYMSTNIQGVLHYMNRAAS